MINMNNYKRNKKKFLIINIKNFYLVDLLYFIKLFINSKIEQRLVNFEPDYKTIKILRYSLKSIIEN